MLDLETLAVIATALAFADRDDFDLYKGRPSHEDLRAALQAVSREIVALDPGPAIFRLELGIGTENRPTRERKRGPNGEKLKAWAPTLNEYNALLPWQKAALKKAIDWAVYEVLQRNPDAGGMRESKRRGGSLVERDGPSAKARRRIVRVTRRSSRKPDEISCDVLGGKMPIDRLVYAGVLAGDSEKWIERRAAWEPAHTGDGRVVIEVFELR